MNFRTQEIIKMLVPGIVQIYCMYILFFDISDLPLLLNKDFVALFLICLLALTYVHGYFLDWFGSLYERLFYQVFSKPSFRLLNYSEKSSRQRIKLLKYEEIADNLCMKLKTSPHWPYNKKSAEQIFKAANYLKEFNNIPTIKEKLNEFYFYSIFSRNISSSFLFTFLAYPILYLTNKVGIIQITDQLTEATHFNFTFFLFLLPFLLCTLRWQEHALYYTRYVFYASSEDVLKL